MRTWTWLHGLFSASIMGGATAASSWFGFSIAREAGLDVPSLNLQAIGILFLSGSISKMLEFLKQKPLPPLEEEKQETKKHMKKLLILVPLLLVMGCAGVIEKARQVANVGFSTATNAAGVVDVLNPFVPDPADTNRVIPNPALVSTTTAIGGMFGPWGVVGGAGAGILLTVGAQLINERRRKKSTIPPP